MGEDNLVRWNDLTCNEGEEKWQSGQYWRLDLKRRLLIIGKMGIVWRRLECKSVVGTRFERSPSVLCDIA